MADLDPKELAQRNVPLIVIYVLALLPLPIWFVVVQGGIKDGKNDSVADALKKLKRKQTTIKQFSERVKNNDPELFSPNHVQAFNDRATELKKQIAQLEDAIRERDKTLEMWFDDPQFSGLKEGQLPDPADYAQYWKSKAIPQMVETYGDLVKPPEEGGDPYLYSSQPVKDTMKRDQKRYWAQKYILEGIRKGAKHESYIDGKLGKARLASAISFASDNSRGGSNEEKPIVSSFRAQVELRCSFRDVSTICREILAQPIPMQILALEVSKHPFRFEDRELQLTVDGSEKAFLDSNYSIKLDNFSDFKGDDKLEAYIPEPPVRVQIEVEILDFDLPPKAEEAKQEE